MVIDESEIRISGEASVKDRSETKMLNPKLETLNKVKYGNHKTQDRIILEF